MEIYYSRKKLLSISFKYIIFLLWYITAFLVFILLLFTIFKRCKQAIDLRKFVNSEMEREEKVMNKFSPWKVEWTGMNNDSILIESVSLVEPAKILQANRIIVHPLAELVSLHFHYVSILQNIYWRKRH